MKINEDLVLDMIVRENILKDSKINTHWAAWSESNLTVEDNIITIQGGTSILKAFYSCHYYLSNPIQSNLRYEVSLYIENLGSTDMNVYINGLDASSVQISSGFKGNICISGNKVPENGLLQIQLLTNVVEDDIKAYIDDILVSEYKNLVSIDEMVWNGFRQTVITQDGEITSATAGDKTSNLKSYNSLNSKLIDSLIIDDEYTISFYFENLTGAELWINILGLDNNTNAVNADFKGILTYTGKRVDKPLQIQVSNPNKSESVKFIVKDVYFYKNSDDKKERIWIPAKSDLNKINLYPNNGEYTEIKAV
ncbi:MAG: hypothetical protein E7J43_00265 [Finegoldia magna]|nr:hypothetical protein [Finegoldia magna]